MACSNEGIVTADKHLEMRASPNYRISFNEMGGFFHELQIEDGMKDDHAHEYFSTAVLSFCEHGRYGRLTASDFRDLLDSEEGAYYHAIWKSNDHGLASDLSLHNYMHGMIKRFFPEYKLGPAK